MNDTNKTNEAMDVRFFFRFRLSFNSGFDREDLSYTQDSVWQHFQTPRSSSKITLFSVFGNVVKHGLSRLILITSYILMFMLRHVCIYTKTYLN